MTSSKVTPLKANPVDTRAAEQAHTDSNGNPRPVLQVEGVNKIYANGTVALKGADLTIRQGEFVSLLGPSGCGKSTLLRIMAGLGDVTTGTVKFWEQGYDVVGDKGRKLAFVFQNATLMPWARVRKNVRLPLDLEHQSGAETERKIDDALEMVGLKGFDNAFPRELSGGMQMRASIARAMVTEPNLLLMDEPFGALDEMTRNKLNDDVLKLWQKNGWTIVFVTHSVYEAVYLSSRVVVMAARPGRIVDDISIDQPFPRNADFRVSTEFAGYCRQVSQALERASAMGQPQEVKA
ncbi:nitrate/sulfonate/bicarbonate ABC transporter ATP-binding protein [Halopseudomonas pachastrellae]|uniref:Nitrate/sulfonate/bicarbonate ABC transporter ATP-binding protein n=1 Tax=Halopseudomonas pachastrellae TaxID=254161 RepID=A0A1S8DFS9_9GAMM|nr:ABC transporter ATP-binding protein [Halopseudomonas pachastrellae]ONM43462.1 nitrate/sulfonate/bicarbonate ABC transporter ATP-binding protein [Halopseudomonas pachastrellae]SFL93357.1 NitT/TauT family transport system ATP-binding protein [Halopseudomonas pachastrellae]